MTLAVRWPCQGLERSKMQIQRRAAESPATRVLHSSNVCPQVSDSLRYEVYTVRRKTNLYLCAKCVASPTFSTRSSSADPLPSRAAGVPARTLSAHVPGRPLGTRA